MATALYRRYRPEAFSEMIGQAHVTEPLMTALRTGRIGHAYLFSGPRGCGKTTSARILARCLNCAEGPTDAPCGTCPSCVELSRDGGGSLDVVEIDAASHGGVDDARDLRERAVFAPARDRYKIFIIDEAHMVTAGGFNALLKIVEEPPPHVKFIFATTEPEKVIGTIRSRTHHYPFRLIAPGALLDYVQQVCESEGIAVEPGVLSLVVRAGGGSVRDTLSILDQLIAGSDEGGITLARATGLLGFTSSELLDEMVEALGAGDAAAAFTATDSVVQTGQDPRRFVEDLLERLRDLIVVSATTVQGASAVFRGVPDDQLERMFTQAQAFRPGQLSRIADTVSAALDSMNGATAPRLHLELMVARAIVNGVTAGRAPGAETESSAAARPAPSAVSPSAVAPSASAAPAAPDSASLPAPPAPSPAAPAPAPAPAASAPQPAAAPSAAAPQPVDVVAALKSAREFLNSDSAGAQRPPMVPLGGHPPQGSPSADQASANTAPTGAPEAPPAAPSVAQNAPVQADPVQADPVQADPVQDDPVQDGPAQNAPAQSAPAQEAVGFAELTGIWPDLLEELLEQDREAWNAVKGVQPLALEGNLLSVGLASRSDLAAFKASGAGPLREAIEAALGITVKYAPKQVPSTAQAPREPSEAASDGEPSPGPNAGPRQVDAAPAPREPEYSEPPAPAWAEPAPDMPEPDIPEPEPEPDMAEPDMPEPEPDGPDPDFEPQESAPAAPPITRYGESVVREVLGARFIEERPLPQGEG